MLMCPLYLYLILGIIILTFSIILNPRILSSCLIILQPLITMGSKSKVDTFSYIYNKLLMVEKS